MEKVTLREKRNKAVLHQLKPVVQIVRSWFLDEGLQYMKSKKMTNLEEEILERVSDHYLESLERIEKSNV